MNRLKSLVADVDVDLDAPLPDEDPLFLAQVDALATEGERAQPRLMCGCCVILEAPRSHVLHRTNGTRFDRRMVLTATQSWRKPIRETLCGTYHDSRR